MIDVILAKNALDPAEWERHEQVENICEFLVERFDRFPDTARIYHNEVSQAHDVTPHDDASIERLQTLEGTLYVVVYPADPITVIIAVVATVAVAAIALTFLKPPTPTVRNTQNESPNNELSERANRPRPLARIPDIFGTVRSTPDLIAVPYKEFINHQEVEIAYMAIGRGEYAIDDVRDDTTPLTDIAGSAIEVYGPGTSPNSGDTPQYSIGDPIDRPVYTVTRSNAVNGQVLRPPNAASIVGNFNISFSSPNVINGVGVDFTNSFAPGDSLTISNSTVTVNSYVDYQTIFASSAGWFQFEIPSTTLPTEYQTGRQIDLSGATFNVKDSDGFVIDTYDLNGRYTISAVQLITDTGPTYYCRVTLANPNLINSDWDQADATVSDAVTLTIYGTISTLSLDGTYDVLTVSSTAITLSNPSAVNPNWSSISTTTPTSPILSTSGDKWIGPFILDSDDTQKVAANFVALNGLYKDDGKNQIRFDVQLLLEITPINPDGSQRASVQSQTVTIEGSAESRSTRAVTLEVTLNDPGLVEVRAKRVTQADLNFEGSVVDEVKWRDVYTLETVNLADFGNVTTVQSITYATSGALALKERKLNMLASRLIPARSLDTYQFGDNADWTSYQAGSATSVMTIGDNELSASISAGTGNFGAYVSIPEFSTGDVFTVTYKIKRRAGGLPNMSVALYEPGGPGTGSNAVTDSVVGDTHTAVLTANRNSGGTGVASILFYHINGEAGEGFTIEDVQISGPSSYAAGYGFHTDTNIVTYANAALSYADDGALTVTCSSDGAFGIQVAIPEWLDTDVAELAVNLVASTASYVRVALYEPGGAGTGSNDPTLGSPGEKSITLTATRDSGGTGVAKVLIYNLAGTAGQYFTINDLAIDLRSTYPQVTSNAADVLLAVCRDPYIGNRSDSEIAIDDIYTTVDQVAEYFGTSEAAEFDYTFASDNLSFEETAQTIAQAIYSIAYRRGSTIYINFEQETDASSLLFNHRNKIPDSETRTVRFGNFKNYDGITYTYVDPDDDSIATFYIPTDRSAVNPQKIESVGVRNRLQAYFHAWRAWNKVRYQNTFVDFEATQEADLLVLNDRILVADNTRTGTQDGEIISQNALVLELSQPVVLESGVNYTIFLQHYDGTVEAIDITGSTGDYYVTIAQAPKQALALDAGLYARASYIIVGDNAARGNAFLVSEKTPNANFTVGISAVNYDNRYYDQDDDYKLGTVTASGYPVT